MTTNDVIDLMKRHVSVRKYSDEQIPNDVLHRIIEAGRAASTWRNLQSYSIIVVTDPEKRAQLAEWTGMPWVATCPVFLVFVGDLYRASVASAMNGQPVVATGVEPLLVSSVDAALASQNIILAAESLGYGGVYIGYIRNSSAAVSALLGLPDYTYPLFGLCLGRPLKQGKPKPRLPYRAVVFENEYGEVSLDDLRGYDQTQADYLAAVGAPPGKAWTEVAADQWATPAQTSSTENLKDKKII